MNVEELLATTLYFAIILVIYQQVSGLNCIQSSKVIISPDSAVVHLADCLDIPCLSVYFATDPHLTGPYQNRQGVLNYHFAACMQNFGRYDFGRRIKKSASHFFDIKQFIKIYQRLNQQTV